MGHQDDSPLTLTFVGGFSCALRGDARALGAGTVLGGTDNDLEGADKDLEGVEDSSFLHEEHISLPATAESIIHLLHFWSMMESSTEPKIYFVQPPQLKKTGPNTREQLAVHQKYGFPKLS